MLSILSLVLAASQQTPKPRVADPALFEELIRKSNEIRAFVAEYELRTTGGKVASKMRIAYRAPGEVIIEQPKTVIRMRWGVSELLAKSRQGQMLRGSVPFDQLRSERRSHLTRVVESELPDIKQDWPAAPPCGPILMLTFSPEANEGVEQFDLNVSWDCPRRALFFWLEQWKDLKELPFDDDEHFVLTSPGGEIVRFSAKTGLIESIIRGKANPPEEMHLVSLDLAPQFDDSTFAMRDAPKDAMDISDQLSIQAHGTISRELRREALQFVSRHLADKTLSGTDGRLHVSKILEQLHADAIAGEDGKVIADNIHQFEKIGQAMREAYSNLDPLSPETRDKLDAKAAEYREGVDKRLRDGLESLLSNWTIYEDWVSDASVRAELIDLEKAAAATAYERVYRGPQLKAWDDMVSKAKGGG